MSILPLSGSPLPGVFSLFVCGFSMRKQRASSRRKSQADALLSQVDRIVEDIDLLHEVLRRACLIEPEIVRAVLQETDDEQPSQ